MIRFWPENKKPGNIMPVEKAKGQATAMPGTLMPETANPGKTIAQRERDMPHKRHHHTDTKGLPQLRPTGVMKLIPGWKEPDTTGILWENVSEKDAYRNETRGTNWIECTCPK
jgi:hypothetical protein